MTVTVAHYRPRLVQDSSREVTSEPQDPTLLDQTTDLNPIIEGMFERLEARQDSLRQQHHEKRLDKHDKGFKVHEWRMDKQDMFIDQMDKLLKEFKEMQVIKFRVTRATQGFVATNWFRLHGDDRTANKIECIYMKEFGEMSDTFARQRL